MVWIKLVFLDDVWEKKEGTNLVIFKKVES